MPRKTLSVFDAGDSWFPASMRPRPDAAENFPVAASPAPMNWTLQ